MTRNMTRNMTKKISQMRYFWVFICSGHDVENIAKYDEENDEEHDDENIANAIFWGVQLVPLMT